VPPNASLGIASDGTISIVPLGQGPETQASVGRIKLVNPPAAEISAARTACSAEATASPTRRRASAVLDDRRPSRRATSTPADALVNMIELSRSFEMQIRSPSRPPTRTPVPPQQLLR
jgi:flagellar basal-body rod protein FlgF